jgi:hypothetical protein
LEMRRVARMRYRWFAICRNIKNSSRLKTGEMLNMVTIAFLSGQNRNWDDNPDRFEFRSQFHLNNSSVKKCLWYHGFLGWLKM